jgi:hypothetical protein
MLERLREFYDDIRLFRKWRVALPNIDALVKHPNQLILVPASVKLEREILHPDGLWQYPFWIMVQYETEDNEFRKMERGDFPWPSPVILTDPKPASLRGMSP